jgi:hypothetical protein
VGDHRLRNGWFLVFFGDLAVGLELDGAFLEFGDVFEDCSEEDLGVREFVLTFDLLELMVQFDAFVLSVGDPD